MHQLTSYVLGRWTEGTSAPTALHNPTTESEIAQVRSGGFDAAAVVAHARTVGGPRLRALSHLERGEILRALAHALHEKREELILVSIENGGTTRGDAKFDIDGAIGTLTWYADLAKSLPARGFLVDGPGLQLSRSPRFWGQHIRVPRPGVALHINAFNFPAWGMLEKMACALLAGMPVIEKPGTPTALLAWRVAQVLVDTGRLPEGSFQFISGSLGDLMEQLGPQDCVAFTGSSGTGMKLRASNAVIRHNLRLNIEADSLNAAVLAPDVEAGSESYNLFLANLVTDITQKTGQKCTATRRILVPSARVAEVRADLIAELSRIKIGNPADKDTRMGPLASGAQFRDVGAGIERLAQHGELACGGAKKLFEKGWFYAPTLIVARAGRDAAFHAEEVFGPCASILPYDGTAAEAAEIVALGGGGLVTSAYANDPSWCEQYVLAAGPWHGRIWMASDKSAEQSLPPGMVLPSMIHGGPGRAGGGEELGSERGLEFYLQRVAVQGFKGLVEASFGDPKTAVTTG